MDWLSQRKHWDRVAGEKRFHHPLRFAWMDSHLVALSATSGARLVFMEALRIADLTRQDATGARLALKRHKERHGC
jgi:hypothetical protein